MIKKTVTYTDYNGVERTEDFYFNLSKAELTEMELTTDGGYSNLLTKISNSKNIPEIIKVFKQILTKSYGVKSDNGKRFIKNQEVLEEFLQSEAYSEIFMELANDTDAAIKFVNGVLPKDIAKMAEQQTALPEA